MIQRIVQRLWSPKICSLLILMALLTALWTTGAAGANAPAALASTPTVLNYQGIVLVEDEPFDGPTGYFKFAIVDAASGDGTTNYWANDGTASGEPGEAIALAVSEGLFNVLLGDTSLPGMTQAIEASVFATELAYLRVWFSPTGIPGSYEALEPNQRIASVAYALRAEYAENGPAGPTDLCGFSQTCTGSGLGLTTSGTTPTIRGLNTNPSGGVGVYGDGYTGVYGSGDLYGVQGYVTGAGDYAVHGQNTNTTSGGGVYGDGYVGVYGAGDHDGVIGYVTGAGDRGVYGLNMNTTSGYGVFGDGYVGVYGWGNGYGVYGSGDNCGVYGYVTGEDDTAVRGENWNTNSGYGVWGDGYTGVYGTGDHYGVYGDGVTGVYGAGDRSGVIGMGGEYGVYGEGSAGVYGWGGHYGVYAIGNTGVYGNGPAAGGSFNNTSLIYAHIAYGTYGIYSNGTIRGSNISSAQVHPTDTNKTIVYGVLEGGESGTYYRGTAQLEKGTARVELPEHFSLVTEEQGLTVQVTPRGDCNGLYVAEVTTTYIVVKELQGGTSNARFDFFINGVRSGYQDFQVLVDTEELGLDALDDPPEPLPPPEEPQLPEPAEGAGQPEGGTDE